MPSGALARSTCSRDHATAARQPAVHPAAARAASAEASDLPPRSGREHRPHRATTGQPLKLARRTSVTTVPSSPNSITLRGVLGHDVSCLDTVPPLRIFRRHAPLNSSRSSGERASGERSAIPIANALVEANANGIAHRAAHHSRDPVIDRRIPVPHRDNGWWSSSHRRPAARWDRRPGCRRVPRQAVRHSRRDGWTRRTAALG